MSLLPKQIIKSIVLLPGEQFVLPPGATVVASTDENSIDSSCGPLENLETLSCYAFVFGNAEDDGNNLQLFEASIFPVKGIRYGGIYHSFGEMGFMADSGSGRYDLDGIVAAINTALGGVLISPKVDYNSSGDNGILSFISFKAPPSVASSLELMMQAATNEGFQTTEYVEVWIKPRPYSDLGAYLRLPPCS
jgi:hypothetical protein